jgi:hypothetical protein
LYKRQFAFAVSEPRANVQNIFPWFFSVTVRQLITDRAHQKEDVEYHLILTRPDMSEEENEADFSPRRQSDAGILKRISLPVPRQSLGPSFVIC